MKTKKSVQEQLVDFLSRKRWPMNLWLRDSQIKVYVRQAKRKLEGEMQSVLDIASVKVEPRFVGQGIWASFIKFAENLVSSDPDISGIYVENVINYKLAQGLTKHGYSPTNDGSFFRRLP